MQSVYAKWHAWQQRNRERVNGPLYGQLRARLERSPAARRVWRGEW